MKLRMLTLATIAIALFAAAPSGALLYQTVGPVTPDVGGPYNGIGAYEPGNAWDAPVFRQFAFVNGRVTQYHVLTPETFLMDAHHSHIYQFPLCTTLRPVLEKHHAVPGDGGYWGEHDAPTRQIVDVTLSTGCAVQPHSQAEVLALALPGGVVERAGFVVNAPIVPTQLEDLPDKELFNGPPYRPRVTAWQDGVPVRFFTYETSWDPQWTGINWPGEDGISADVFMISYGAVFRPGFTIFNVAVGTPLDPESFQLYSPMWRANCVVDADNPKCMISVNLRDPAYHQCRSVAECLTMENSNGNPVQTRLASTFTHINCPMVAVDLNLDDYIGASEELIFPDLWVDGPVLV